jgi:hypothetical protein
MENETCFQPVEISKCSLIENSGRNVMVCDVNINNNLQIPKSSFILGVLDYDGVNGVYNIRRRDEVWNLPISGLRSLLVGEEDI